MAAGRQPGRLPRRPAEDPTEAEADGYTYATNPAPVTAEGPGAERFAGQHPNTFVHDVLSDALGI